MKKILSALVLGLTLICAHAQNEKNIVIDANAELRNVSGFNGIEVSGAIDLYVSQGTVDAVAISAGSEELKSRIRTEIKGTTLHIYFDGKGRNWKSWGNNKMKAYVTFKNIHKIEASGVCNVKVTGTIRQNDLSIEMSGASDFTGDLKAGRLRLEASGASDMKVSGTAESAEVEATGACNIRAYELKTNYCKVDASGASNVHITVNKELNADASGGSTVSYKGAGLIRNISSSGGASVKHKTDD